jgi:2-polyprenyl-3-methyl-5-hydroxy-6-metoxy-1,4-benzoquinol methylase
MGSVVNKQKIPKCVCGSMEYSSYLEFSNNSEYFFIKQCDNCGLLRTIPVPNEYSVSQEDLENRVDKITLWKYFAEDTLKWINKYQHKSRSDILDIGCNIGVFVKSASDKGFKAIGIDTDREAIEIGKQKFKTDLRIGSIDQIKFSANSFDYIVLSHTLEHIEKINSLLQEIKRIIKTEGYLIIIVPNIESLPVKIQKIRQKFWYGYDFKHHVWHFTPKTLQDILTKAGFIIVEVSTSTPLFYEKNEIIQDIFRNLILKVSSFTNKADQIILVAKLKK